MNRLQQAARQPAILVVDDDPEARRQLAVLLQANGYRVLDAANGRLARGQLDQGDIDLVISDIFMPECDGFELIAAIRTMALPVPVIAMSDHESWTGLNFLDAANDLGAAAVVEKPFRADILLRLIGGALAAAEREARVVAMGALAAPDRGRVPVGLEWVGGRVAEHSRRG